MDILSSNYTKIDCMTPFLAALGLMYSKSDCIITMPIHKSVFFKTKKTSINNVNHKQPTWFCVSR